MTLETVKLIFPSLNQLWAFVREGKINYKEFNTADFSLTCDCAASDLKLAKEKFGAKT
jgi:hypothetical protein